MQSVILVAIGGAAGAVARHVTGLVVVRFVGRGFPLATIVVNVVGCALLGWLLAESRRHTLSPDVQLLVGTGLCGALTTFSTFGVETLRLMERGQWGWVAVYLAGNLVLGLGAAALGLGLGRG